MICVIIKAASLDSQVVAHLQGDETLTGQGGNCPGFQTSSLTGAIVSCDNSIYVVSRVSTRDRLCFKRHCPPGSSELWLLSGIYHSLYFLPVHMQLLTGVIVTISNVA